MLSYSKTGAPLLLHHVACNQRSDEQELPAAIFALRQWRCYLEGAESVLVTDHHPNTFNDSCPQSKIFQDAKQGGWSICSDFSSPGATAQVH